MGRRSSQPPGNSYVCTVSQANAANNLLKWEQKEQPWQIDVADIEVGVVIATVAIEERLARIEATPPHLASKAVLKSLEARMYGVMVAVVSAGAAFLKLTGT